MMYSRCSTYSASNHDPCRQMSSRRILILRHLLLWAVALLVMIHDADAVPDAQSGQLLITQGADTTSVPSQHTTVNLVVTGPLIRAVVEQEFINPTDEVIEASYVFPLPDGAAVSAMSLQVGDHRIVSVVQEKEQARRTYEQARESGHRTALVASQRPNLFATRVANIGPGQKVTVRLEYLDQADYESGWFSLVVPLTYTPRYANGAVSDPGAIATVFAPASAPDFPTATVTVTLNPGVEVADIDSDSHVLEVSQGNGLWRVSPVPGTVRADRDFLLRWHPVADPMARPVLFTEDGPDGRYALLMVVPGEAVPDTNLPATETVFVVDISGSMDGPSLAEAQQALATALQHLRPGDRFNVLAFNQESRFWANGLQEVSPVTLSAARRWVRMLVASGGTELHPALLRAQLSFATRTGAGPARRIILLTDAAVGNEDQLLRETIAQLGQVRLHVVGIGMAPNRYLVRRLAGQGGGLSTFVAGQHDLVRLVAFMNVLSRPQLANPNLDWSTDGPVEGYPARLGAPFAGVLTLWSGRFAAGTDTDGFLRGQMAGHGALWELTPTAAPAGAGIAVRWAKLKVDDLMAAYDSGGPADSLRQDIVKTAVDFGLVTRFTSRVAVEERVTSAGPQESWRLASGLPAGSMLLPQGGTLAPLWRWLGTILLAVGLVGWKVRT